SEVAKHLDGASEESLALRRRKTGEDAPPAGFRNAEKPAAAQSPWFREIALAAGSQGPSRTFPAVSAETVLAHRIPLSSNPRSSSSAFRRASGSAERSHPSRASSTARAMSSCDNVTVGSVEDLRGSGLVAPVASDFAVIPTRLCKDGLAVSGS